MNESENCKYHTHTQTHTHTLSKALIERRYNSHIYKRVVIAKTKTKQKTRQ